MQAELLLILNRIIKVDFNAKNLGFHITIFD